MFHVISLSHNRARSGVRTLFDRTRHRVDRGYPSIDRD
jgi:hypothetical protein